MTADMLLCPICAEPLMVRLARGRKSGKPFVMLRCARDGRHYRGFINHRPYVLALVEKLEAQDRPEPESKS